MSIQSSARFATYMSSSGEMKMSLRDMIWSVGQLGALKGRSITDVLVLEVF